MSNFYVPSSLSGSYVANKRNEEGSLAYPGLETEAGIQKQEALQNLQKNYSNVIDNAFASYMSSRRGINEAAMGQGYKEAYKQMLDQQLNQNLVKAGLNAADARAELQQQENAVTSQIHKQYETDVSNLDRVAQSFNNYLTYIKDLTSVDAEGNSVGYLSGDELSALQDEYLNIDDYYQRLWEAQPQDFTDTKGARGKTYLDFVQANLKDTAADKDWWQWLSSGGLEDFKTSILSRTGVKDINTKLTERKEAEYDKNVQSVADTLNYLENTDFGKAGGVAKMLLSDFYGTKHEYFKTKDEFLSAYRDWVKTDDYRDYVNSKDYKNDITKKGDAGALNDKFLKYYKKNHPETKDNTKSTSSGVHVSKLI